MKHHWVRSFREEDGLRLESYELVYPGNVAVLIHQQEDGTWQLQTFGPITDPILSSIEQVFESLIDAKSVGLVQARLSQRST